MLMFGALRLWFLWMDQNIFCLWLTCFPDTVGCFLFLPTRKLLQFFHNFACLLKNNLAIQLKNFILTMVESLLHFDLTLPFILWHQLAYYGPTHPSTEWYF